MAQSTLTIDRLFDRSSRLPYPLRARTSPVRRWTMLALFVTLSAVIGVYWYMTDARRVREMAEEYLSQLSGAQVSVGKATLSIFEGLRLDDVRVFAETPDRVDPRSIHALPIFSASRFQISYNLNSMLRGRLEATRIVATNPRMLLAEDLDTHTWNYQKLSRQPVSGPDIQITGPGEPLKLPELQLRDARLEYVEVRGGVKTAVGSMALEGHLVASPDGNEYRFEMQSRGISQGMGPSVSGAIDIHTGRVVARARNFVFGRDIKAILPAYPRNWMEQHALAGRLDVPVLIYTPPRQDQPATFRVETELDGVALRIDPAEWMSRDEIAQLGHLRDGLSRMDAVYRGLHLGLPTRTPYEAMAELLETEPIDLQTVSGSFLFTENGIEIRGAGARIEGNSIRLSGKIDGYSPEAPLSLRVASRPSENLVIPAAPRYINAIPGVRELFLHLRPQGECRVEVELKREEPGERAVASGVVELVDAQFQYVRFPYPVQRTSGRIEFGPDKNGVDRLDIHELRGHGVKGGPNEKSVLTLKGTVAPLGPDAGIHMVIQSDKIVYEPILHRALPPETREILKLFEAPGHPGALKFEGGFVTRVNREPGYDRDVYVETDVRLDDAAGVPEPFPYPLNGVRGMLKIYDDHLDIEDVTGRNGDATVKVSGRVHWTPFHEREGMGPNTPRPPKNVHSDIKIEAMNVPIDQTLIEALPPEKRPMLQKLGISGRVDVKGTLTQRPAKNPSPTTQGMDISPMRYDLALKIKDGGVHPKDTEWSVGDLTADVKVTPERLVFEKITATRTATTTTRPATAPTTQPTPAMIVASGAMELTDKQPKVTATVSATNLLLDRPFYQILPKGTQAVWDEVRPDGTVDLSFTLADGKDKPFTMTLRPRELAIQPAKFPLKMDRLSGEVRVRDELVTFDNLQARSGPASLYIDGTQRMDMQDWNVKLSARELQVTEEFLNSVPGAVKTAFKSIGLKGKIALDFEKLRVYVPPAASTQPATTAPATAPAPSPEIDFIASLWLENASMDVGVPIEKANGRFTLATSLRQGRLDKLDGTIEAWTLSMAGREVTNFRGKLGKRPDVPGLRLDDMQADVAGGTMAGRMDLIAGDPGPSRYVMNFSLRNADIAALTQETDQKLKGTLSASLSLEGVWGDPAARRGRGDVAVQGKQIVKLPLLLGLFQITNLALPITGPLSDATARYNIDGPVVTFERIELKGANVLMSGDGKLDFDKKTVRLRFNADNPGGLKIPVISDLLESGTRELLQIHVKGTIEQPKVRAGTFGTISTTVDEVLGGDEKKN